MVARRLLWKVNIYSWCLHAHLLISTLHWIITDMNEGIGIAGITTAGVHLKQMITASHCASSPPRKRPHNRVTAHHLVSQSSPIIKPSSASTAKKSVGANKPFNKANNTSNENHPPPQIKTTKPVAPPVSTPKHVQRATIDVVSIFPIPLLFQTPNILILICTRT